MTPTEMYKRAESLFNERTKRELADMVVHREADLEDARAENAKLRNDADLLRSMLQAKREDTHALMSENAKLRDGAYAMRQLYEDELKHALAENAKLRELVRDYERCTMHADCSRCEYDGKLSTHCPLSPCFPDADELRELGVDTGDAID